MKRVLAGIAGVFAIAVLGFGVAVAMQPDTLHVERSTVVAASTADVYGQVNDLKAFEAWNPWKDLDPNQTVTFAEPTSGVGAWYTWSGNSDVGSGKMSITAVQPDKVTMLVQFNEPMESEAQSTFSFAPEGDGTKVVWAFDSHNDLMSKAFGLMMDMDKMLGDDFEKGLARLKPAAEEAARKRIDAERVAAEEVARMAAEAAAAAAAAAEAEAEAAKGGKRR